MRCALVSFVLFGVVVLGGAYLFARYARGYLAPIALWPMAVIFFFVLNSFRMRFELVGPLSPYSVDFSKPLEATMTFIWFGGFYLVMASADRLHLTRSSGRRRRSSSLSSIAPPSGARRIEEPDMFRICASAPPPSCHAVGSCDSLRTCSTRASPPAGLLGKGPGVRPDPNVPRDI